MAGETQTNSYSSMLRGSAMLGGVQVLQMLVNLVKGKFVAMILGPEGMGITSLFNSASATITQVASLGLNMSFVKEVAATKEDPGKYAAVRALARKLAVLTSLLGAAMCVFLSPWLSRLTFGGSGYEWQFCLLGAAVFLTVWGNARLAVLQGLHEVRRISKASVVGALTGLCVGVPLYWLFGTKGIVPAMVLMALAVFIFYSLNLRKADPAPAVKVDWRSHMPLARKLLANGMVLAVSGIVSSLVLYAVGVFIRATGSTSEVGLYQAANNILLQYSSLVTSAMAVDYFPRLAATKSRPAEFNSIVARELDLLLLFVTPIALLVILFAPVVVNLILTAEFAPIVPLVRLMALGFVLKMFLFPLGYIAFAQDNRRVFFLLECVFGQGVSLAAYLLCFHWFGLIGIGYALAAIYIVANPVYAAVNHRLYGTRLPAPVVWRLAASLIVTGGAVWLTFISGNVAAYSALSVVTAVVCVWNLAILKRKLKKEK